MPTVIQLEEVYSKLLGIVKKEVDIISEAEELNANNIRALEAMDKILRASLEYYSGKPVVNDLTKLSDEELLEMAEK